MATYITPETLATLDLTPGPYDENDFDRDTQYLGIPAARRAEAFRCWLIAKRVGAMYHLNIQWQALGGKSDAQIAEILNARVAQHQRSAGARELKRKYGQEAARRIINKHRASR